MIQNWLLMARPSHSCTQLCTGDVPFQFTQSKHHLRRSTSANSRTTNTMHCRKDLVVCSCCDPNRCVHVLTQLIDRVKDGCLMTLISNQNSHEVRSRHRGGVGQLRAETRRPSDEAQLWAGASPAAGLFATSGWSERSLNFSVPRPWSPVWMYAWL